jgi:hypothetical protein
MYPALDRFAELRARVDPTGVLQSDLQRRLGLPGPTFSYKVASKKWSLAPCATQPRKTRRERLPLT